MAEDNEDWFDKDLDKMQEEVQKKISELQLDDDVNSVGINPMHLKSCLKLDQDFGGSYNIDVTSAKAKSYRDFRGCGTDGHRYVQQISYKKLLYLADLSPLDAFLEVYQTDCGFFESFSEEQTAIRIKLIIVIMAKLSELPFQGFGKDYLINFLDSSEVFIELEKILNSNNNCTDVFDNIIKISWKAESLGVRCENLKDLLRKIGSSQHCNNERRLELKNLLDALENQENVFKEIYPSLEDIKGIEYNDIRPNIIKGKYSSVGEYIHTHLSLLREDFIAPLRESIQNLQKCGSFEQVSEKQFYEATRFLLNENLTCNTAKGLTMLVDLMANERKSKAGGSRQENIVNTKKLMYGTLLCFASNLEFGDLILAIVSHSDSEKLTDGYIYVEILKMYNIYNIFDREFVMFESEVYFEPYHHVHRAMRGLCNRNFPMKNYIVDVEKNSEPPDYLQQATNVCYTYHNYSFNPLVEESYPLAGEIDMDSSQHAAFIQSLSKKFSLIQGPPGTGKTFIGLKIVSTLVENVDAQILIVCYTNHALDQFLSGILESTKDIVRLGSQSKRELLDEYNIKQLADGTNSNKNLKAIYFSAKMHYSKLIEQFVILQQKIEKPTEGTGEALFSQIMEAQENIRQASAKLDELKQIFEYLVIKNKKVIGMTTTYAARSNLLLKLLKTPIVIVEEAAEILEPHIIVTLTQSTEHVILIGDHQQLRPTTSVYKLSEKFQMDISLFERLVRNNLNSVCLNTQYRMRPEIANLLRHTIYDGLRDAVNVESYENVRGMAKNMFFINHDHKELKRDGDTSKRNPHEVNFLLALANYLLMREYKPSDIVILCTYNGQLFEFLNARRYYPRLEKVRIAAVDSFQGEESKIILLSLVRNNTNNQIGYLAMKNRICVALSRAQEGFYVSGSIKFLAQNNSTWNKIKYILEEQKAIGDELPILCKDGKTIVNVRTAEDFQLLTSGTHLNSA